MRVIINDSSVLIDLAKARLIENALQLPYQFVIPDVIFADELLRLKHYQRDQLLDLGFVLGELDGARVATVYSYSARYTVLSINDCFALVLAETTDNAILLTGDKALRVTAEKHGVETRGILWLIDQMQDSGTADAETLHAALQLLAHDPLGVCPA